MSKQQPKPLSDKQISALCSKRMKQLIQFLDSKNVDHVQGDAVFFPEVDIARNDGEWSLSVGYDWGFTCDGSPRHRESFFLMLSTWRGDYPYNRSFPCTKKGLERLYAAIKHFNCTFRTA